MEFERKRYHHPYVNIAPLVDVVFLLLLFFMLSSHLVREPAIKLQLPASRTATSDAERVPTLDVTAGGTLFLEGEAVELSQLQGRLSLLKNEQEVLRVRADRRTDVGMLIQVVDEVRSAGIESFRLVTLAAAEDGTRE